MSDDYDSGYAAGYDDAFRAAQRGEEAKEPLTLDAIKQMSQDEINRRWDEILPVLEGTHGR
jgi:hypothetical protein